MQIEFYFSFNFSYKKLYNLKYLMNKIQKLLLDLFTKIINIENKDFQKDDLS